MFCSCFRARLSCWVFGKGFRVGFSVRVFWVEILSRIYVETGYSAKCEEPIRADDGALRFKKKIRNILQQFYSHLLQKDALFYFYASFISKLTTELALRNSLYRVFQGKYLYFDQRLWQVCHVHWKNRGRFIVSTCGNFISWQ